MGSDDAIESPSSQKTAVLAVAESRPNARWFPMRHINALVGVVLAATCVGACAGPQVRRSTPNDVFEAMDMELSHSLVGKADAVGTTTLTSTQVEHNAVESSQPEQARPLRTWGVPSDDVTPNQ